MLTGAPPRKANHAGFLESDRIRTLDLPQDGRLPSITEFVESAMKVGQNTGVRPCARLTTASPRNPTDDHAHADRSRLHHAACPRDATVAASKVG